MSWRISVRDPSNPLQCYIRRAEGHVNHLLPADTRAEGHVSAGSK